VSSALAGVAGGLFAHYLMYIHTNSFTFLKSFEIIIMIVIGGLGSISGSILGAVLFITLTEGLRQFAQYRMIIFSLLLIILMIVRPQGILGHREFVTFLTRRRKPLGPAPGTTDN
jgi:branched-chain amino acid transport system permease protein